jgi:hypothetical protein
VVRHQANTKDRRRKYKLFGMPQHYRSSSLAPGRGRRLGAWCPGALQQSLPVHGHRLTVVAWCPARSSSPALGPGRGLLPRSSLPHGMPSGSHSRPHALRAMQFVPRHREHGKQKAVGLLTAREQAMVE